MVALIVYLPCSVAIQLTKREQLLWHMIKFLRISSFGILSKNQTMNYEAN